MNKRRLGRISEEIACKYLLKKGFRFIGRNIYCGFGEIDLLFWDRDDGEFVVVEVRSRFSGVCSLSENFSRHKINRLKGLARYVSVWKGKRCRVDVILVAFSPIPKMKLKYVKNVLLWQ